MFDDLDFDNLLTESDDCHECQSDARYCYIHTHERAMTRHAMECSRQLKAQRERKEMDDIRTTRLAKLRNIAESLSHLPTEIHWLIAAAEDDDDKLRELHSRVSNASYYANYCWAEEARTAEE